jgi:hypothetical protein
MVSLLQNLADMDITYKALQVKLAFSFAFRWSCSRKDWFGCFLRQQLNVMKSLRFCFLQDTDIGRHVNGLRKHPSSEVRQLVKLLVR